MKKLPTAEEYALENMQSTDLQEIESALIGFAQLHVAAALKVAARNAKTKKKEIQYTGVRAGGSYFVDVVDEQSILTAYPLDNIK